jgi:hypothetical protein
MPGVEELPGLIARLEKVAIRLETATKAQTYSDQAQVGLVLSSIIILIISCKNVFSKLISTTTTYHVGEWPISFCACF